jgi:hypothetical protein
MMMPPIPKNTKIPTVKYVTKIPNHNDEHCGIAKTAAYLIKQNDRAVLHEREIGARRM